MNRELLIAEWRRAQEALGSARVLTERGYYADSVARAYYAIFHAAKTSLHSHDVIAQTHSAVRAMFGLHLVKSGEIEAQWAKPLGESVDARLAADYDPEITFTKKQAQAALRDARAFLSRIRSYLLANGLNRSELAIGKRKKKKHG